MRPGGGSDRLARAVEAHLPQLLIERVALIRGVKDCLVRMVYTQHFVHIEVTLGELALQLSRAAEGVIGVIAIEIEMGGAIFPAGKNYPAIGNGDVILLVEKLIVMLFENKLCLSARGVGKVEVPVLVVASQSLDPDRFVIGPAKARDIVFAFLNWKLDPRRLAAVGT